MCQKGRGQKKGFFMSDIIYVDSPSIKRKDLEYVLNCMVNDKIDYGDFAKNFEKKLKDRINCFDVLAVNSFYNAINLILSSLSLDSDDEVLLPSFSPQIYLNVVVAAGLKPVLFDLEEDKFKPSLESIKSKITEKSKVLILPYYFGYIYDSLEYSSLVPYTIEDITSIIGYRGETKIGDKANFLIADFSPKNIITTGGGGAIFCKDKKSYQKITSLIEKDYFTDNYYTRYDCLISDLNASMGCAQIETLNHRLKLRNDIGKIYEEAVLKSCNKIIRNEDGERVFSSFPIIIKNSLKDAINYLKKDGIESKRPFEYPLHHYLNIPKDEFRNTENFYLKTLLIPINSSLSKKEVYKISKAISIMI